MENAQVRSVWCVLFLLLLWNCSFLSACGVGKSSYTKKDYQPFRQFQQKPEEEEESAVASGPFHHKIKYGSKEFRTKLVRYVGTNVVFKDDEGTGADRYMTKRCRRALERLAQHVRVKWNNKVKLRVIEAWDEDGEHYARSLHYEGRAIDITTSDRDRGKYGDLASLAYFKAEFDWVTYVDGHVHISCKKDDAVDERNSCFPSHGTVLLESGLKRPMSSLQIGDRILTMSSSGKPVFSPVIMFMDTKPEAVINGYVVIESINPARRIELTGKHLIFASKDGVNFQTVFAEKIQPGDFIKVVRANNTGFASAQVVKVHLRQGKGAYAPLTEQGTVVVNGVLASCYALTEEQQTAHLSFLPWRLTYDVMKHFESAKPQTGLHWYVRVLRTINSVLRILPEV